MNAQQLHIQRDGLTLSAKLYGEDNAPLVVLLHGFPDTPHSWNGVLPHLLAAGYRVLTPWLRGYTAGSASRSAQYDLLTIAADIEAWRGECLGEAGHFEAHLVGHDWGAAIANVIAGQQAAGESAWRSISLLAVPPMPQLQQWLKLLPLLPQQLRYSSYMPLMQLSSSHRLLTRNNAAYVERLWRQWSPGWEFSADDFAPVQAVFTNSKLAWATTRYYRNLFRWHDPRVREAFALMQKPFVTPTLALIGEEDGCMHPRIHDWLANMSDEAQTRGSIRFEKLPNCGHFLQAEQPERVAATLLAHFELTGNAR